LYQYLNESKKAAIDNVISIIETNAKKVIDV
jgi:hypothetical protein